ncbi:orotidine 5'-phosphate decarboxylase [Ruminococcaceae bacterium OttesenSCG-928-I18]|nr:orotidine 5'-phosphate decarboxylase [Ruminococcaceae bacterium OttesenSCG-928-I18]
MKLQLALDFMEVEQAAQTSKDLDGIVDIIEAGTLFILKEGIGAVRKIKEANPSMQVLADLKIMDAGDHEARLGFEAGADLVTVLGAADNATIAACVEEAKKYGKQVVADMIAVRNLESRAREVEALGVDYLCVHTAFDLQAMGLDPLADLSMLAKILGREKIAVAGGVKLETLPAIAALQPGIVVVGGAITKQPDVKEAAKKVRDCMSANEGPR